MSQDVYQLSPQLKKTITHWTSKFPKGKQASAVLMALRLIQDDCGYLQPKHIQAVADFLVMKPIDVQAVAEFYSMFRHKPSGQYQLKVCNSIACYLRGSNEVLQHLAKELNVAPGEVTADGLFSFQETECLGSCCSAPCMLVGDHQYHIDMSTEKVDQLLDHLRKESQS